MALFGSSEKKPEVKTEFMFDTESTINQSTLAKDIKSMALSSPQTI